jgi:hypothetical protein
MALDQKIPIKAALQSTVPAAAKTVIIPTIRMRLIFRCKLASWQRLPGAVAAYADAIP